MKHVSYDSLEEPLRGIARLAFMARLDTHDNGRRSFTGVASMKRQPVYKDYDPEAIRAEIFSRSTGKPSREWEAWECPECGQAWLGIDSARECCREDEP